MLGGYKITRYLIAKQYKAKRHYNYVGNIGVSIKFCGFTKVAHRYQYQPKRQYLADLNTDIKRE